MPFRGNARMNRRTEVSIAKNASTVAGYGELGSEFSTQYFSFLHWIPQILEFCTADAVEKCGMLLGLGTRAFEHAGW